jgi:sulfate adenylyltransferase
VTRHALAPAEQAEVELRLAGLLSDETAGPAWFTVTERLGPGTEVVLEDRGGTPVAHLTVLRAEEHEGRHRVAGTLRPGRPFEDGVARDRRATGPRPGTATLAAFSSPPTADELDRVAALARPLRAVAVVTHATDDHEVWHLLTAVEEGTGERAELLVLPGEHGAEPTRLRAAALDALAADAEVVDVTGPAQASTTGDGTVVLLTGLSGSGKSTIARALADHLQRTDPRLVTLLDGDEVRRHLSAGLGFSAEDRRTNLLRIAWVAALCARHGGIALCAPIAPYAAVRAEMRALIEPAGRLVLVHVSTPLEVCEARDRKGLYARARAGEITGFTGIDDPYEPPEDADLTIDTSEVPVADAVARIAAALT